MGTNAFEIPGLRFSLVAAGTIERYRFVSVDTDGNAVAADATTRIVGASYNKSTALQAAEIVGDGIAIVEAGEAVASGNAVYADADGKAIDSAGTIVAGIALTTAAAAGDLIAVKLA